MINLYTGWTSDGHTGEDVNTYAYGPRSNHLVVISKIQKAQK